jgi:serine/threonine protein kinase
LTWNNQNILVLNRGPNWWIKIADFGISKRIEGTALRTVIGTEAYLAPEVRGIYTADCNEDDEHIFSLAVDIWAIGAITYRMYTGRLAFPTGRQLFNYVVRGSPFLIDESMSSECIEFVTATMAASPRSRPTPQQALFYKWIQEQEVPVSDSNSNSNSISTTRYSTYLP